MPSKAVMSNRPLPREDAPRGVLPSWNSSRSMLTSVSDPSRPMRSVSTMLPADRVSVYCDWSPVRVSVSMPPMPSITSSPARAVKTSSPRVGA